MTSFDRFEGRLPALLDELVIPRLPDYAEDLFARTAATRQRPGWTFPERWLPMSAITRRFAAAPSIPWRLGALVALLALAALIAVLVAGALNKPLPAPYGPAANGEIIFVNEAGEIVAGDPGSGTLKTLVAAPGGSAPIYSRDGSRFAFMRPDGSSTDLFVADADGTHATRLSTQPIPGTTYVGWSGRGDRILVVDGAGRMLLFSTAQPGPATILNELAGVGPVEIGNGYNFSSTHAFRPPTGDEIVFVDPSAEALLAVRPDGTGLRSLIDKATAPLVYAKVRGADWTPDGSKLLVMLELESSPDQGKLFVLNADGTGLRQLLSQNPMDEYNSVKWSPDGTRIGFQWWTRNHAIEGAGQEFHGIGVLNLASGVVTDLGPVQYNGFTSWDWSPDGESILAVPGDGSNDMQIVNVATGSLAVLPWSVDQPITWRRVAPAAP